MVNISQPKPKIPDFQIGDGKEEKRFKLNWSFKGLKDWFVGITIKF